MLQNTIFLMYGVQVQIRTKWMSNIKKPGKFSPEAV